MNNNYEILFFVLLIVQFLLALGVVLLAARRCRRGPSTFLVRMLTLRHRWWLAMGLLIAPCFASNTGILWMTRLLASLGIPIASNMMWPAWPYFQMGVRTFVAVVCGAVGCWAAAELDDDGRVKFRVVRGLCVATALSLYFLGLTVMTRDLPLWAPILPALILFTFQLATSGRAQTRRAEEVAGSDAHQTSETTDSNPPEHPAALGLVLAFLPSVLMLFVITSSGSGFSRGNAKIFWPLCIACLGLCFVSSFLMFKQRKVWAIVVGIVLMVLNLAIAFLLGCVAVVFP